MIVQVFADHDILGHAYRLLQERDCPSRLYPVGMGVTIIVGAHSLENFPKHVANRVPFTVGTLELDAPRRHH